MSGEALEAGLWLTVLVWAGLGVVVFFTLLFIDAPYGRYARARWGPRVDARVAWMSMEGVSFLGIAALFVFLEGWTTTPTAAVLGALWLAHYANRTFVYPLRLPATARAMPLTVVLMAAVFNVVNAGTNGLALFYVSPPNPEGLEWLRVGAGIALFVAGAAINLWSDRALLRLRRSAEGYALPRGGLFERVSCPNYLGEILEWTGFAIAAWNPAAAAFALWTFANLAPRARAHHRFYREQFPEMPTQRRALIPFLW